MKLNLSDRIYTTILGLYVSYASLMYATHDTRAYAIYFLLSVVASSAITLILYRDRILQALFKNAREINKHPTLRDDLDLL